MYQCSYYYNVATATHFGSVIKRTPKYYNRLSRTARSLLLLKMYFTAIITLYKLWLFAEPCHYNLNVRRQKSVYIHIQYQPPMPLLLYCLERGICVLGTPLVNNCAQILHRLTSPSSNLFSHLSIAVAPIQHARSSPGMGEVT